MDENRQGICQDESATGALGSDTVGNLRTDAQNRAPLIRLRGGRPAPLRRRPSGHPKLSQSQTQSQSQLQPQPQPQPALGGEATIQPLQAESAKDFSASGTFETAAPHDRGVVGNRTLGRRKKLGPGARSNPALPRAAGSASRRLNPRIDNRYRRESTRLDDLQPRPQLPLPSQKLRDQRKEGEQEKVGEKEKGGIKLKAHGNIRDTANAKNSEDALKAALLSSLIAYETKHRTKVIMRNLPPKITPKELLKVLTSRIAAGSPPSDGLAPAIMWIGLTSGADYDLPFSFATLLFNSSAIAEKFIDLFDEHAVEDRTITCDFALIHQNAVPATCQPGSPAFRHPRSLPAPSCVTEANGGDKLSGELSGKVGTENEVQGEGEDKPLKGDEEKARLEVRGEGKDEGGKALAFYKAHPECLLHIGGSYRPSMDSGSEKEKEPHAGALETDPTYRAFVESLNLDKSEDLSASRISLSRPRPLSVGGGSSPGPLNGAPQTPTSLSAGASFSAGVAGAAASYLACSATLAYSSDVPAASDLRKAAAELNAERNEIARFNASAVAAADAASAGSGPNTALASRGTANTANSGSMATAQMISPLVLSAMERRKARLERSGGKRLEAATHTATHTVTRRATRAGSGSGSGGRGSLRAGRGGGTRSGGARSTDVRNDAGRTGYPGSGLPERSRHISADSERGSGRGSHLGSRVGSAASVGSDGTRGSGASAGNRGPSSSARTTAMSQANHHQQQVQQQGQQQLQQQAQQPVQQQSSQTAVHGVPKTPSARSNPSKPSRLAAASISGGAEGPGTASVSVGAGVTGGRRVRSNVSPRQVPKIQSQRDALAQSGQCGRTGHIAQFADTDGQSGWKPSAGTRAVTHPSEGRASPDAAKYASTQVSPAQASQQLRPRPARTQPTSFNAASSTTPVSKSGAGPHCTRQPLTPQARSHTLVGVAARTIPLPPSPPGCSQPSATAYGPSHTGAIHSQIDHTDRAMPRVVGSTDQSQHRHAPTHTDAPGGASAGASAFTVSPPKHSTSHRDTHHIETHINETLLFQSLKTVLH